LILILCYPFLLWKTFSDAGYKSWQAFVPIYNYIILLKIIQKPFWWFIIWLIPYINIFMIFLMAVETAKCYGKYNLKGQALAVLFPFAYFPFLELSDKYHFTPPDKQTPPKKTKTREWVDALIFAVVAAFIIRTFMIELYVIPTSSMEKSLLVGDYLFVSKMRYGPKTPNTPLAIPFIHNNMPVSPNTNSYVDWIQFPYYRFPKIRDVKNYDNVVFNYPTGDTVVLALKKEVLAELTGNSNQKGTLLLELLKDNPSFRQSDIIAYRDHLLRNPVLIESSFSRRAEDYYRIIRHESREKIHKYYKVIPRPIDKRENYVKRCVAIAGDTLLFDRQNLYINGTLMEDPPGLQYRYRLTYNGAFIPERKLRQMGLSSEVIGYYNNTQGQYLILTIEMAKEVAKLSNISSIEKDYEQPEFANPDVYPFEPSVFSWNEDNFGPLYIPEAGRTIELTKENMILYRRLIETYEKNEVKTKGDKVWINGELSDSYTFKMNYYWMMGDNRNNSLDSRFWGFVPEDHVVGTPAFIFFSVDKDRSLSDGKIRFNRIFKRSN
jgi:signal peptidase I